MVMVRGEENGESSEEEKSENGREEDPVREKSAESTIDAAAASPSGSSGRHRHFWILITIWIIFFSLKKWKGKGRCFWLEI